jgi:hypothetical protein
MNIDIELTKHGLQQVQTFEYKVGDYLFDSIAYLLNYSISSELIQKNSMCFLQECLTIDMPQALECRQCELNPKNLDDLHHGEAIDEITYIQIMSLLALNGGLWNDFIAIYWISKYLQLPIHIWNKNNYQIMMKIRNENANHVLTYYMQTNILNLL